MKDTFSGLYQTEDREYYSSKQSARRAVPYVGWYVVLAEAVAQTAASGHVAREDRVDSAHMSASAIANCFMDLLL